MNSPLRWLAAYLLDFVRERVTADDFAGDRISRLLVAPGLDDPALAAVAAFFPGAELTHLHPNASLPEIRRGRFEAAIIPMAGGPARPRLLALLSGARHKLLVPSPDYIYRFGLRGGPLPLFWAVIDHFLLAPLGLVLVALSALAMWLTGLVGRALSAESGPRAPVGLLAIRLTPTDTFVGLLRRLRERWPGTRFHALLASAEGDTEVAELAEVVCSAGLGPREVLRRVRALRPDLVVLAGGADYVLRPAYWKAALIARLSGARTVRQWEPGDEPPGRPPCRVLGRLLLRSFRRLSHRWFVPVRDILARPWLRRSYHRLPRRGPKLVQIGITEACNYHCLMCPFHNPVADRKHRESELPRMSYALFARLLGDLKRMGTRAIDICGNGEPLSHPEAIEMIALARTMGFEVQLATNAGLLTPDRARRLVDLGLRRMHVSINAGSNETYSQMHPGTPPGAFDAIISRLRDMADYADATGQPRIEVEFSAVLTRLNQGEIVCMVEAAHEARANWFMLILMGPVEGQPDLPPAPESWPAIRAQIAEAKPLARQLGIESNLDELDATATEAGTRSVYEHIPCYIGHEFALIIGGGIVIFCCHCHEWLGDLNKEDFAEIWNSEAYQQARRQAMALPKTGKSLPGCGCFYACSHVSANLGVHRRLYGKRGLRPIS